MTSRAHRLVDLALTVLLAALVCGVALIFGVSPPVAAIGGIAFTLGLHLIIEVADRLQDRRDRRREERLARQYLDQRVRRTRGGRS